MKSSFKAKTDQMHSAETMESTAGEKTPEVTKEHKQNPRDNEPGQLENDKEYLTKSSHTS